MSLLDLVDLGVCATVTAAAAGLACLLAGITTVHLTAAHRRGLDRVAAARARGEI